MRTTIRIDGDLMMQLKSRAQKEHLSLSRLLNRVLRHGLESLEMGTKSAPRFREKAMAMGMPSVNLDKALALSSEMEEEEVLRKMDHRK